MAVKGLGVSLGSGQYLWKYRTGKFATGLPLGKPLLIFGGMGHRFFIMLNRFRAIRVYIQNSNRTKNYFEVLTRWIFTSLYDKIS